jgi:hypothetical protein
MSGHFSENRKIPVNLTRNIRKSGRKKIKMDRKITNKYSRPYFLADPEVEKMGMPGVIGDGSDASYPQLDNPTAKNALIRANDEALKQTLLKRERDINTKYGANATSWIVKNFGSFDPEERLKLYYILNKVPKTSPLSGVSNYVPEKGDLPPVRIPGKIIGDVG